MTRKKRHKQPKKTTVTPSRSGKQTITWRLSKIDWHGPWGKEAFKEFSESVMEFLKNTETMTLGEITSASGAKGKGRGNHHHEIEINKCSKRAQKRLSVIKQDDRNKLFSFRVGSLQRIYGIREGNSFWVIWFDPWHNDHDKAVYPV